MLKLKIGQNYLLLDYNRGNKFIEHNIAYMMGCFKGQNKLAYCHDNNGENVDITSIIGYMDETHTNELYILQYVDYLDLKKKIRYAPELKENLAYLRFRLANIINSLRAKKQDIDIKVININAYQQSPEYRVSFDLLRYLMADKNSIASVLPKLETYKHMSKRLQSIPSELKIIENDIRKLNKEVKVCDRTTTLTSIDYLNLIEKAEIKGMDLELIIKEIPIYPSERLGAVFRPDYFENNPYLFKAASYIYQEGYNFKMPRTRIKIGTDFRPVFIETLDHTFDKMFSRHNWSTIGYPHFGQNHLCPGEFNDTIAHAKEYGLDYYFIALKQYLTTANMRDCAGVKVWWFPIYDKDNNLVYCAGADAFIEEELRRCDRQLYDRVKDLSWPEKVKIVQECGYTFNEALRYGAGNMSYSYNGPDAFLKVCEHKDKELYEKLRKDGRYNG